MLQAIREGLIKQGVSKVFIEDTPTTGKYWVKIFNGPVDNIIKEFMDIEFYELTLIRCIRGDKIPSFNKNLKDPKNCYLIDYTIMGD